jgi:MinD-like ATPase involved in chromosome partitioning or flagellar assembly
VRESGDAGAPIVVCDPESAAARAFRSLAESVAAAVAGGREVAGHA